MMQTKLERSGKLCVGGKKWPQEEGVQGAWRCL